MFLSFGKKQRAKHEAKLLQNQKSTYSDPLDLKDPSVQTYLKEFELDLVHWQKQSSVLRKNPAVFKHFTNLVPGMVSYEDFFCRYYFRCDVNRVVDERRVMKQHASKGSRVVRGLKSWKQVSWKRLSRKQRHSSTRISQMAKRKAMNLTLTNVVEGDSQNRSDDDRSTDIGTMATNETSSALTLDTTETSEPREPSVKNEHSDAMEESAGTTDAAETIEGFLPNAFVWKQSFMKHRKRQVIMTLVMVMGALTGWALEQMFASKHDITHLSPESSSCKPLENLEKDMVPGLE